MSEIRDKVKEKLGQIYLITDRKSEVYSQPLNDAVINQILSIPEMAIVDREAELPEKTYGQISRAYVLPDREFCIFSTYGNQEYLEYGESTGMVKMLKEGWVKEIKE